MSDVAGTPADDEAERGFSATAENPGARVEGRQRVLDQIEIWRTELVNLARSNRLLYFRPAKSSTLEIVREPDLIGGVVAELLAGGSWRFYLPREVEVVPHDESGDENRALVGEEFVDVPKPDELLTDKPSAPAVRNALRLLERRSTQEFMDKGIWILYMAVGVLRWVDPHDNEEAQSPLVLMPVQVRRENSDEPYELSRIEEDIVINPALSLRMADFGIELPLLDQDDFDADRILDEVERSVSGMPGWTVERRLLISPFSFHKEVMFRDLLNNAELVAEHPVVQALALGADAASSLDFEPIGEERLDEEQPPEEIATILDADATQRQCIAAAAAGRSFVMDGPPGTGKSQTIANVIAELLAQGRTVLFVSEKAAALEVVQKRLRASGLGDYTLELHSHKATRKEVAQQLGGSLSHHPAPPAFMSETSLSQLRLRREQLSRRAQAVNEIRQPLGRSLHDAIGRVGQLYSLPQAPLPPRLGDQLSADGLAQIITRAGELANAWGPVTRGEDFLWRDVRDVHLDAARAQRTAEEIAAASALLETVRRCASDASESLLQNATRSIVGSELALQLLRHLENRRDVPSSWLTDESLDSVTATRDQRRRQCAEHAAAVLARDTQLGPEHGELDVRIARQIVEAAGMLDAQPVFSTFVSGLHLSELAVAAEFARSATATLTDVASDSGVIERAFGLVTQIPTVLRAIELAELGELAASPIKPETDWLNPARVKSVDRAIEELAPACARYAELQAELSVFNDQVLQLDLETLRQRFETVHHGFAKLGSAYREDKKTLAGTTRAGKADNAVVALLPKAIEWQAVSQKLEALEAEHAAALGEHYYRRTDTDFGEIAGALTTARRATELAGPNYGQVAFEDQIARGRTPDGGVVATATRIGLAVDRWTQQPLPSLTAAAEELSKHEIPAAGAACEAAASALNGLSAAIAQITLPEGRDILIEDLLTAAKAQLGLALIEDDISRTVEADQRLLGQRYDELKTDWDQIDADLAWARRLRELTGGPLSAKSAERALTIDLPSSDLHEAIDAWYRARDHLLEQFEDARAATFRRDLSGEFEDAFGLLDALAQTTADIDEWVDHTRARSALLGLGLAETINFCEQRKVVAESLPLVVERACLEGWIDHILESDAERLNPLRADQLDQVLDEFRRLDTELITRSRSRVTDACNRCRPRTTIGAAGVIRREAEKKRRHMPVRKLLEEAGQVAQALKPCFMMSPLTVSQFLPPSLTFDAIVFDEASQVRPSDAINCVYRGSQLIVAGDDKQLPPTSFFEAVSVDGDDEWEDQQFEQYESILKLCKSGGLRELPLRWHYRSQHEDLITYSNESFYRGRLVTFPGSVEESERLGVKLYHVPGGLYRRGTARDNPRGRRSR